MNFASEVVLTEVFKYLRLSEIWAAWSATQKTLSCAGGIRDTDTGQWSLKLVTLH